jgi:hypothetical protein
MTGPLRNVIENTMDAFGQLLIVLVAKLSRPAYLPDDGRRRPVRRFVARQTIDGIVRIGRGVDQLNLRLATTPSTRFRNHVVRPSAVARVMHASFGETRPASLRQGYLGPPELQ